jgi:predicted ribosomally synthesized peptide with nif11-like leader
VTAEGATGLFERIRADEQFRAQLEAAATPEEKRKIVTDAGYDVDTDDLPTIRKLSGMSELSDKDVEKVAGGADPSTWPSDSATGPLPGSIPTMTAAAVV